MAVSIKKKDPFKAVDQALALFTTAQQKLDLAAQGLITLRDDYTAQANELDKKASEADAEAIRAKNVSAKIAALVEA